MSPACWNRWFIRLSNTSARLSASNRLRHKRNCQLPMTGPLANSASETDPERRNWVWWSFQVVLRLFFAVWLRYRARGHQQLAGCGGMLLVINHQSFLDPLLVALPLTRPVSFLARVSLFRVPVVGWVLRNTYVFP